HLDDVRVAHLGRRLRLAQEALDEDLRPVAAVVEDLDRDGLIEVELHATIDRGEATPADLLGDLVSPTEHVAFDVVRGALAGLDWLFAHGLDSARVSFTDARVWGRRRVCVFSRSSVVATKRCPRII